MAKKKARSRNIVKEFGDYFGNESKLANWQMLCSDVGIEGDLSSLNKCKAVRNSPPHTNPVKHDSRGNGLSLTICHLTGPQEGLGEHLRPDRRKGQWNNSQEV